MESIKESYTNTVSELNQELLAMKEAYQELDNEKQSLIVELDKRSAEVQQAQQTLSDTNNNEIDELRDELAALTTANQAWEQFHQSQLTNFREQLQDHIPVDENLSLEQIGQQIINQFTKERNTFNDELVREKDSLLSQIANLGRHHIFIYLQFY